MTFALEREAPALANPVSAAHGKHSTRRRRWSLIATGVGLLIVLLAVVALSTSSSTGGALDPRSAAPDGSRALAQLLRARGITVERGVTAGPGRTVLVPFPQDLTRDQLGRLLRAGADVVLVDPGPISAAQLTAGADLQSRTRPPACSYGPARVAGPARLGGTVYTSADAAVSCYDGTLLVLPAGTVDGGGQLVVLGSADFLRNDRLDQQGNAALAIGMLSAQPQLTWYSGRRATSGTTLSDLLPESIPWALLQLGIAVAVVGVWRGRRLGPVVSEPLPVIVRSAETVVGRARLYAVARARDTAAEALRAGSRARLAALLHLDTAAPPPALISAVARATGADGAAIAALLYAGGGALPAGGSGADGLRTDAALIRLADQLDQLEKEVAHR
jgi:hypothetical protein